MYSSASRPVAMISVFRVFQEGDTIRLQMSVAVVCSGGTNHLLLSNGQQVSR